MDGLFAGGPTFQLAKQYGWKYLITLKDKDLPTGKEEFEALCTLEPKNRTSSDMGPKQQIHQEYRWMNEIASQDTQGREHLVSVLECVETKAKLEKAPTKKKFKWITDFYLTQEKSVPFANGGGRLRWRIEPEGFNVQKTGGFEVEHAYSEDQTAKPRF